jgi:hypothetical protein
MGDEKPIGARIGEKAGEMGGKVEEAAGRNPENTSSPQIGQKAGEMAGQVERTARDMTGTGEVGQTPGDATGIGQKATEMGGKIAQAPFGAGGRSDSNKSQGQEE